MSHILFFALKDERVTEGVFRRRGADLPSLGKANSDSAATCQSFLVCEPGVTVNMRTVALESGGTNYHIDQLINPDTVIFTPGGLWTEDIVLYGRFATTSISEPAKRLMTRFNDQVKKHFVRVKAYHVGPKALGLLEAGKRLTIAQQSPRDFDLTLN